MPDVVLQMDDLTAGYGQTRVLEGVSLTLSQAEAISVIGRNGVGKTTLLETIMGHTTLHGGAIHLQGNDISRIPVYRRADAGIGYVPQEREIFPSLTVRENLHIGERPGGWNEERVCALFPNLESRMGNAGNQLSGGEQQMLSIARALMANPKVLLMDEPSEGLAPVIVEQLSMAMAALRRDGDLSIILVEQNSRVALDFSDRTIVLDRGRVAYDGTSAHLRDNPDELDRLIAVSA